MSSEGETTAFVVPSYRAPDDEPWYHFLHGNVPGHQIDFMYRPEVPQGRLARQHFSHLARLMKYIEPHTSAPYAFAIGNLSRDDTQHEPGHGGLALIFGLRIRGVTDHAGRQDPPFSHGIAAVDRELDAEVLLATARAFHRHVLESAESAEWYRAYVRCAIEVPAEVPAVLAEYASGFRDLPQANDSTMKTRWILAPGASPPKRVVIVHPDDAAFDTLARCASRIAAMLYPSDIRWTAISNGREADVPNGVTVRLVAESALGPADEELGPWRIADVPEDEAEIARQLFNAVPAVKEKPVARGWRERYSAIGERPSGEESSVDIPRPSSEGQPPPDRSRSERPPTKAAAERTPPPEARDSVEVLVRVSDPVSEDAVTVGAPLQRVDTPVPTAGTPVEPPRARLNGAAGHLPAGGGDLDTSVDDDGGRRASFDLGVAAPLVVAAPAAREEPPQRPSDKEKEAPHDWAQRETMVAPQVAISRPALPFQAPAPPPPIAPTKPEVIPDFRASGSGRWLLAIAAVTCALIAGLYFMFADSPPPDPVPPEGTAIAPSLPATADPVPSPTTAASPSVTAAAPTQGQPTRTVPKDQPRKGSGPKRRTP